MKSKGLIVEWSLDLSAEEGSTSPMVFNHENPHKARVLGHMLRTRWRKTFNELCGVLHNQRNDWVIVIETDMDYTNPRTGKVTTERIKSTFRLNRSTLYDCTELMDKVQRDDMADRTKTMSGRTIRCYCKT